MKTPFLSVFALLLACAGMNAAPLRVAIVGLAHGHIAGFLNGGALAPAGGLLHRDDAQLIGVVEADDQLFAKYAARYHWSASMHFHSIDELASKAHPDAALLFTSTAGHTEAVEQCAQHGIHVMMEKPMAVSYRDALAMQQAALQGHIHVLVDYETSWYASNQGAYKLLKSGAIGPVVKTVFRDGHEGPKKIRVQPEFLAWLTDPQQNGAGALYDFGCYGADLMTWIMEGEAPVSVSAVTRQIQPEIYPKVDDEADVLLTYPHAVAILQGSWDWPFSGKEMDVYGRTGYAKTVESGKLNVRRPGEKGGQIQDSERPEAPYDDPLHFLAAVIHGQVEEGTGVSSLKTNVVVSEILDAARQSARTGQAVKLPLQQ